MYIHLFFCLPAVAQIPAWSGAITENSAAVIVFTEGADAQLEVYSTLGDTIPDINRKVNQNALTTRFDIKGLQPSTFYNYVIRSGQDSVGGGSFTTFGNDPGSFRFVAGSCMRNASHPVFETMLAEKPMFFICPGDIHYADIKDNNYEARIQAFKNSAFDHQRGRAFFSAVPLVYMWDDHDYCGNNTGAECNGRETALQAYRDGVPHYPLHTKPGGGVYQAFTVGNIRFILSDLRSERTERYMMSAEQEAWFRREVIDAVKNGQMICWVSSVPWIGTSSDTWGEYRLERRRVSEFLRDNNVTNFFMIAGDAHMLAADNGLNADYSSERIKSGFPVLQAAALNQVGTHKGGPFSEGAYPNPDGAGQFGLISVVSNSNEETCIEFTGKRVYSNGTEQTVLRYSFCKNFETLLSYNIYPNPTEDSFTLHIYNAPLDATSGIEITDIAGRRLQYRSVSIKQGENKFHFQGEGLGKGIYIVRFWYRGHWYSDKLCVVK